MERKRQKSADNGRKIDLLPPSQEAVVLLLATGRTVRQAATETATGERTIYTWLSESSEFRDRLYYLRSEMTGQCLGRLTNGMTSAADTLLGLLEANSEMVRLSASRSVIELAGKVRQESEIEERLAALERLTASKK